MVMSSNHPLSPAELRSLRAIARYDSTRDAASQLSISEQTLKNELSAAYRKLDVRSRTGAFNRLGWLRVPPHSDQSRVARARR